MGFVHKQYFLKKVKPEKEGMKIVDGYYNIKNSYPDYLKDESNVTEGKAEVLFFPKTIENIAWVIEKAKEKKKTVTIAGGRTGICGGAVPYTGWLISMDRMKRVLDVSCEVKSGKSEIIPLITLEPGIRLNEINQKIRENDFGISNECTDMLKKSKIEFFYPPDPTETTATIGGTVATNASGARTLRYGPTRNYIYGITVVLPTGHLLNIKRGDIISHGEDFVIEGKSERLTIPFPNYSIPGTKHSAGFFTSHPLDLVDLFIGSEGLLGIIANITIKLEKKPRYIVAGISFFKEEDHVIRFVEDSRINSKNVLCLEYFDDSAIKLLKKAREEQGVVSEIPSMPDISNNGFLAGVYFESSANNMEEVKSTLISWENEIEKSEGLIEYTLSSFDLKDINRFKAIRHSVPEMINRKISEIKRRVPVIHKVGTDMAVPDGFLSSILAYYRERFDATDIEYIIFGHIGNNHLHVNMLPRDESQLRLAEKIYFEFAEKAVELGGSVSGEHGIGKLKKKYLKVQFSDNEIEIMRKIKLAVDPDKILNPGNLFD